MNDQRCEDPEGAAYPKLGHSVVRVMGAKGGPHDGEGQHSLDYIHRYIYIIYTIMRPS